MLEAHYKSFIMEEKGDIKKLMSEIKHQLDLEIKYTKLTAVENTSVLLSRIAIICVMGVVGVFALFYILSTLVDILINVIGQAWIANAIIVVFLLLVMLLIYAFRKQWIINPIARFISKLFLNLNDYERKNK